APPGEGWRRLPLPAHHKKTDMARRNLSSKQPAKNIAAQPPTKKTMNADGVMVTEKLCPIPFNRKMLAPDGDCVRVPLANGFTIRGLKGNDYGVQKLEEKLDAGFLPWNECPLRSTHESVRGLKGEPCDPKKISDDEPCKHLLAIAEKRKAAYRKERQDFAQGFATNQDRMVQ